MKIKKIIFDKIFFYNLDYITKNTMEKILIICQHYPPINNIAAARPYSWFKYFNNKGLYPIIFCKNNLNDDKYFINKEQNGEVHYIKYDDHFFQTKIHTVNNNFIKKIYILLNLLFQNDYRIHNAKKMLPIISDYIELNNIKKMIVTGNPFALFGIAHQLHKKYKIKWIADYRDDWSTNEILIYPTLVKFIDTYREKKYLKSCNFFTSVSEYYIYKINKVIEKKGYLIENGFYKDENKIKVNTSTKLNILYFGTIYKSQKLKIIIESLELLPADILENIEFNFVGVDIQNVDNGIKNNKYINRIIFFKKRVPFSEVNNIIENADLMICFPHYLSENVYLKGATSTKLYDYIKSKKQILVCPSDKDIVERKLKETKQGLFCENPTDLANEIIRKSIEKKNNGYIPLIEIPEDIYYKNTREYQAYEMCNLVKKI